MQAKHKCDEGRHLLASEGLRVSQAELRSLHNVAKIISFESVNCRIYFYFFDRDTTCKYELDTVPFNGMVYRVSNRHQLHQG